jgi:hypothetical protein
MTRGDTRTIVFNGPAPEIVCICGSTTYADEIEVAAENLTLAGAIVLQPVVFLNLPPRGTDRRHRIEVKQEQLQFRRIDMADRVVVVAPDGEIGLELERQIGYAELHEVPVSHLNLGWKKSDEGFRVPLEPKVEE